MARNRICLLRAHRTNNIRLILMFIPSSVFFVSFCFVLFCCVCAHPSPLKSVHCVLCGNNVNKVISFVLLYATIISTKTKYSMRLLIVQDLLIKYNEVNGYAFADTIERVTKPNFMIVFPIKSDYIVMKLGPILCVRNQKMFSIDKLKINCNHRKKTTHKQLLNSPLLNWICSHAT